jgi:putative ABC transport system permease protein
MLLTADHIDYIIKDVQYRGIVAEGVGDELIDHICSATEAEMQKGLRFLDAYHTVLRSFGQTSGLRDTQKQVLLCYHSTAKNMIKNYFTIAIRNLKKHRFYTFINVAGLATGVAACMIIVLFVLSELSFDKHHEKANRIYRVNSEIKFGETHYKLAQCSAPLVNDMLQEFPEVEAGVRFRSRGSYLVKKNDAAENIKEENVIWTDSSFFQVFTVPLLQGNANKALSEPKTVCISKKVSDKFFPNNDALGQTLILDNNYTVKITGVFDNMPESSHFNFDILISLTDMDEAQSPSHLSNNFNTYLLLHEGSDAVALESKFPAFVKKYVGPQAALAVGEGFSMEKFIASGNKFEYTLIPLLDIHLHSDLGGDFAGNGNITYVYLFSAIALFILVIACINFMNLSTARSSNRAKEVGVRKVMGSLRPHLVGQFLSESVLISLFSFLLALMIAYISLPVFNMLSQKNLSLPWSSPLFYGILLTAAFAIGLLAGLYPSFFLSAFKPINVLKGNLSLGMKSGAVRSSLVVFQFVISIFLIIGTLTIYRQLNYIQNKKIGFEKDQVIVIHDVYALNKTAQAFKEDVLKNSSIESGTLSGFLPVRSASSWRNDNTYWPEGVPLTDETMIGLQTWSVDYDYIKTLGIKLKEGRFLSPDFLSDSTALVINESAAKRFGFMPNPIGKKIVGYTDNLPNGAPDPASLRGRTVVGVVEDFHFESLKENITPLAFFLEKNYGSAAFRFQAKHTQDVIQSIEASWKKLAPTQPFSYSFLDEDFASMYKNEQRLGETFGVFAALAIIIACLGLFALTAFTAEQRTKEIGIRKVLGASVSSIVLLLSKEFGKLIFIAFVLAAPLAWYAIQWWLKDYTYKVEIGVLVYVFAGVFAFMVAWLTMGYQSIKAARSNPVKSLRSE